MSTATSAPTGRIAIISHSHPELTKGGAELAAYALYQGLLEQGHDAIFIGSCLEQDAIRVTPRAGEYLIPRDDSTYDHMYHIAPGGASRQLAEILTQNNIEIVNFHHYLYLGLNALRMVQGLGMKVLLTLHEYLAICHHHGQMVTRPRHNLCRAADRVACQACFPEVTGEEFDIRRSNFMDAFEGVDAFISPSHFLKQRYVEWGLPEDKVHVVENGLLDLDKKLAVAEDRLDPDTDDARSITIGYFGQITPFKGVDVILRAIERIEQRAQMKDAPEPLPVRFRIHGNQVGLDQTFINRFDKLEKESAFLEFNGPYENTDVLSLMRACDYVIVPSQWWENSPVVIQEAFAAGTPVIASALGGLAEKVVDGQSGLLFRMGDPDALLTVLKRAASTETLESLRAGLPRVLTTADMADEYVKIFGSVS